MPTYQYECSACGHSFESFQSMTDHKLKKCPSCGKNKLCRLIGTGGGIIFKGSGFYETDYKRKAERPTRGACDKNQTGKDLPKTSKSEKSPACKTCACSGCSD
ncbi:MAG: zinc ribbon domain-containing protein [Candidatus Omnitrophota bacterium]